MRVWGSLLAPRVLGWLVSPIGGVKRGPKSVLVLPPDAPHRAVLIAQSVGGDGVVGQINC